MGIIIILILLSAALYLLTSTSGVQLCIRTKYIRIYTSFLGIKFGKWKTTRNYTDLAILTIRKKVTTGTLFNTNGMTINQVETGVYLLLPSHRKRHLITICKEKSKADEIINNLSKSLDKNISVFNPKISEATKNRRYR